MFTDNIPERIKNSYDDDDHNHHHQGSRNAIANRPLTSPVVSVHITNAHSSGSQLSGHNQFTDLKSAKSPALASPLQSRIRHRRRAFSAFRSPYKKDKII
jgi:hypothetical protein